MCFFVKIENSHKIIEDLFSLISKFGLVIADLFNNLRTLSFNAFLSDSVLDTDNYLSVLFLNLLRK